MYGLQQFVAKKLAMLVNSHYNTGWVVCSHIAARTARIERFIDLLIEIGYVSAQYPKVLRGPLIDAWIRYGGHMDCCAERRARLELAFDADPGMAIETIFAASAASPPRCDFAPSRWDRSTGRSCSVLCATCIEPQTTHWLDKTMHGEEPETIVSVEYSVLQTLKDGYCSKTAEFLKKVAF